MRRFFATVRFKTTAVAVLVVAVALAAGAMLLLVAQERSLVAGLDQSAGNRAADVADLARRGVLPPTLTAAHENEAFTQVVSSKGKILAASKNLEDDDRVVDVVPRSIRTVTVTRTDDPDGTFRVVARRVTTPTGTAVVYAGNNMEEVTAATKQLATLLAIGLPLFVLLVGVLTWLLTGRALRPVEEIRAEVSEIGERELHRRVPTPRSDDEIGRLARTMNEMLARLDDSADRQQRFVGDASHELQSPLTSLRARLEVNLAAPHEPDWRAGELDALDEVVEMQSLVDDLLTLARLDAASDPSREERVDVQAMVEREAARIAAQGRVTVEVQESRAGHVLGNPDQLRRAIRNVLDNAGRHASRKVTVSARMTDDDLELRFADDGPGVPAAERSRIFERFAQVDDARTRDGTGTGLGLAITRDIVESHGGTITLDSSVPGACFVIRLPVAPEPIRENVG